MTLVASPTIGLEEVQRKALYVIFDHVNSLIDELQVIWDERDSSFAQRLQREFVRTELEPVPNENFHDGHRPSLIDAPINAYPNISVMAHRAVPGRGNDLHDHQSIHRNALWVEVMVKSERSEEEAGRRVHRLVEAVHISLMRNPTLEGIVGGFETAPNVSLGDMFTRKERTAYGQHWFFQGARLEYAVRKESAHPASSGPVFQTVPVYDIDQS